ncbi:MAG: hypothetical protein N2235_25930, partial [Fischerella sp.]|nr:hypothetical protein [Fischerella sp.]
SWGIWGNLKIWENVRLSWEELSACISCKMLNSILYIVRQKIIRLKNFVIAIFALNKSRFLKPKNPQLWLVLPP